MTLRRITGLAILVAFVSTTVASTGQAGGGTPITSCGQVVTTTAFLTQDLYCPGSHGVVVGASGITIDLKGFTLRGDRSQLHYGIDDSSGFDGVSIKNGVVRNFYYGVAAHPNADTVGVSNLVVSGSTGTGIYVAGASTKIASSSSTGNSYTGIFVVGAGIKIQSSTASGNGLDGIAVFGSSASLSSSTAAGNPGIGISVTGDAARIQSATASGNGLDGIVVSGNSASVKSSTASGNGAFGIGVDGVSGDGPQLKANRAEANGFASGASDLAGLGIVAAGFSTEPSGTNVARGNDDPAECSPAFLC